MQRTRVAVVGLGNVGRGAAEALAASPDFELAGVVRRRAQPGARVAGPNWEAPAVTRIDQLEKVRAALKCPHGPVASRQQRAGLLIVFGNDVIKRLQRRQPPLFKLTQEPGNWLLEADER